MRRLLIPFVFLLSVPVTASDMIKIRIFSTVDIKRVEVTSSGGQRESICSGDAAKSFFSGKQGVYLVKAAGKSGSYEGKLMCEKINGFLHVYLETGIEYYTAQVLASEADDGLFNENYAEALAVVIRTYAYENRKRHGGYDLCDSTHCQKLKYKRSMHEKWKRIVLKSENLILKSGNDSVAFYAACCGGLRENSGNIWGKENMAARPDNTGGIDFCSGYKYYTWVKRFDHHMVDDVLQKFYPGRTPEGFEISKKTVAGRARVISFGENMTVNALDFHRESGRLFGWAAVPSLLFEIHPDEGGYLLKGRGQGHGCGLCMAGASVMGKSGYGAEEILNHYFPGCDIEKIYKQEDYRRGLDF